MSAGHRLPEAIEFLEELSPGYSEALARVLESYKKEESARLARESVEERQRVADVFLSAPRGARS